MELSLIETERTEFGTTRTACDCARCAAFCEHLPGYLIPADLTRLAERVGLPIDSPGFCNWCEQHLFASQGALIVVRGRLRRVPTLVPRSHSSGACVFFTDGRCSIHADAPFGCAFFDAHQRGAVADAMSLLGLRTILDDLAHGGVYTQLWSHLRAIGCVATDLAKRRSALEAALARIDQAERPTEPEEL